MKKFWKLGALLALNAALATLAMPAPAVGGTGPCSMCWEFWNCDNIAGTSHAFIEQCEEQSMAEENREYSHVNTVIDACDDWCKQEELHHLSCSID